MTNPVELEHKQAISDLAETLKQEFADDIADDNWEPLAEHFTKLIEYYTSEAVDKTLTALRKMQEEGEKKLIT